MILELYFSIKSFLSLLKMTTLRNRNYKNSTVILFHFTLESKIEQVDGKKYHKSK
jgi:hypothetical protein